MKNTLALTLALLLMCSFSSSAEDKPRALSVSKSDLGGDFFNDSGQFALKILNDNIRTAGVYKSPDSHFSLSGFELKLDETNMDKREYDGFPRAEMMFFIKGGIKLIDEDGNVSEAGTGEMIFIPQGWKGTRIFTGNGVMQKFSAVYYENVP